MSETNHGGSSWFWNIFGTTLISGFFVLLMVILNALNTNTLAVQSNLTSTFAEYKKQVDTEFSKIRDQLKDIEIKNAALEEFKVSVKDKLLLLENNVSTTRNNDKEYSAHIAELRERLFKLEEKLQK